MDSLCVILLVLAIILFAMGLIVGYFQKRMMSVNLDNTLTLNSNIEVENKCSDKKEDIISTVKYLDKKNNVLKYDDTEESLNFIDDEIL